MILFLKEKKRKEIVTLAFDNNYFNIVGKSKEHDFWGVLKI